MRARCRQAKGGSGKYTTVFVCSALFRTPSCRASRTLCGLLESRWWHAGIEREQVNYINAHATSTLVGDVAEVKAVRSVFSDWSHIKMNGTKSMLGHCLGAAAGVEAIATVMAIKRGEVHPTINHDVRLPSCVCDWGSCRQC